MGGRGKRAVFVDRDGTICFDKHYLSDPEGLELIPTVPEGLKRLNQADIPVIVVTNQSGIARGYFTEETLDRIHKRLKEMLAGHSARFDDIFYCPHLPNAGCTCRKPSPGLLLQAQKKYGLNLTGSFVIGDRIMDVEMAHTVNAIGVLVPEPRDQYKVDEEIKLSKDKPDFKANTFAEAVDWILDGVAADGSKNSTATARTKRRT